MTNEVNNKKHNTQKILLIVLIAVLGAVILFFAVFGIVKGVQALSTPDEFMVETENYFDYQQYYECSGYASAYVLRSLGEEATGLGLYGKFENKNADGTLPPIYLKQNLNKMGYKCSLKMGDLTSLKYDISRGTPVVALIRISETSKYLHYVAVVGFDKDNFYVADSLDYMKNADNENYNRVISKDDFKKLWKCYPESISNCYLKINLK